MKNRLPRKKKKALNKAIARYRDNFNKVHHQQSMDEFVWGFSAVHVNSKTGEMKNVPIDEAYKLLNKQ